MNTSIQLNLFVCGACTLFISMENIMASNLRSQTVDLQQEIIEANCQNIVFPSNYLWKKSTFFVQNISTSSCQIPQRTANYLFSRNNTIEEVTFMCNDTEDSFSMFDFFNLSLKRTYKDKLDHLFFEFKVSALNVTNSTVFHGRFSYLSICCNCISEVGSTNDDNVLATFFCSIKDICLLSLVECVDNVFSIDILVHLGTTLSFIGLFSIFLSACILKDWYKKRLFTLQLSVIFTLIAVEKTLLDVMKDSVILLTTFYCSVLIQFFWMFLIGVTQYQRLVKVFYHKQLSFKKYLILSWLLPPIPPFLIFLIYGHPHYTSMTFVFVSVPVLLVIFTNICIYSSILYNVIRKRNSAAFNNNAVVIESKIALFFPFLLGITWVFAFGKLLQRCSWPRLILVSVGRVCIAFQPFVLFLFSVLLDECTRSAIVGQLQCRKNNLVQEGATNGAV